MNKLFQKVISGLTINIPANKLRFSTLHRLNLMVKCRQLQRRSHIDQQHINQFSHGANDCVNNQKLTNNTIEHNKNKLVKHINQFLAVPRLNIFRKLHHTQIFSFSTKQCDFSWEDSELSFRNSGLSFEELKQKYQRILAQRDDQKQYYKNVYNYAYIHFAHQNAVRAAQLLQDFLNKQTSEQFNETSKNQFRILLAKCYHLNMQLQKAQFLLNTVCTLNPSLKQKQKIHIIKGSIFTYTQKHKLAMEQYQKALILGSKDLYLFINLINISMQNNNQKKALSYCQKMIQEFPDDINTFYAAVSTYNRLEQRQKAIKYTQQGLKRWPKIPEGTIFYDSKIFHLYVQQRFEQVVQLFKKIRRDMPEYDFNSTIHAQVADSLQKINRHEQAIEQAGKVTVDKQHKFVNALIIQANCHQQLGRQQKAKQFLYKAVRLNPKNFDVLYAYARHLLTTQNIDQAVRITRKAQKIDGINSIGHQRLGLLFYHLKLHEQAIRHNIRAFQIDQSNSECLLRAGSIYFELNNFQRAIQCFDMLLKIYPNHKECLSLKGRALTTLRKFQEAKQILEGLIRQNAIFEDLFYLALIYDQMGESIKALALISRAMELQPDNQQGKICMDYLRTKANSDQI